MTLYTSIMKRLLTLLLMALLGGLVGYGFLRNVPPVPPAKPDLRMPTGKPLLEPDRPDLIGDPGIQPEDNDEGDTI
ncbi:MAG: hypothetical protein P8M18_05475 [Woeseiaceae bacterium]|nr:hypothetical protein [Woeseiaceae bacterium]